ncbi:hypothetical protein PYW07_012547 [Mythimna separata]|uniref:SET domain-containing protein n=1 Tax=Mythimna separata TaxID=271217 RepID=A0AAD7Y865_MYTSE|nr:hypothetical protein PYW07_012547 [Mythimna separata]
MSFNLRKRSRLSYYEPKEPSFDEYLCAGLGVFSTLTLPRGVRFGPYCGQQMQTVDSMYCWQIFGANSKRLHVVDAADEGRSNWMRYVNCARHSKEQNLLAFQYKGQLYYRTIKIIPRYTELLVFYGSEFANALHINLKQYNSAKYYKESIISASTKSLHENKVDGVQEDFLPADQFHFIDEDDNYENSTKVSQKTTKVNDKLGMKENDTKKNGEESTLKDYNYEQSTKIDEKRTKIVEKRTKIDDKLEIKENDRKENTSKHRHFYIDDVYPKETVYPMIVGFQNGYVTKELDDECLLLEDENTGKKIVATELCDLLYRGEEEEEDLGQTLILARNVRTGKVRLIEAKNIELKPQLKSHLDTTGIDETSYLELSRKFGSKKHKQIMEHREKLKINVQTVTEQMQNVTDSITEDQLDLSAYNKADSDEFYIPTINREATNVDKVYDIDSILTSDQVEKIYSEIEGTKYMSELNPFLKSLATKELSKLHTVLLVYAQTLLQLYSTLMKDINKKTFTACPYSGTLNQIVLNNFLSNINGKRGRSPQYKDKSLCHALVFILLINNYKFNFNDLCQELKLTQRTVTSKVALTGATLVTVGDKKIAQLKLPLNRPALRRKSSKF